METVRELLRQDARKIITASIGAVLPDAAVARALEDFCPGEGRTLLVAAGKAAWQMARAAVTHLGRVDAGIVITKYGHGNGEIPNVVCYEAGHPVPDEQGFAATGQVLDLVKDLHEEDRVLFLLSGGGSALFELPLIPGEELQDITGQLLACGADIVEINTLRKRLSAVKGGRFALACAPAKVFSIVLSDVLGDRLDMIASGPACPDTTTCDDARTVADKYSLKLSDRARAQLNRETPKQLSNVTTCVTGSVRELVAAAAAECEKLGYAPVVLTDSLCCEAKAAGQMLARELKARTGGKTALIAGGETVVHVTGTGLGGRNQELALAAAEELAGMSGVCLFSLGSDGTDGPTDAAGGYVDGQTAQRLAELGIRISTVLHNNNAYHALKAVDGLIFTGPTGTNVNDVAVALRTE